MAHFRKKLKLRSTTSRTPDNHKHPLEPIWVTYAPKEIDETFNTGVTTETLLEDRFLRDSHHMDTDCQDELNGLISKMPCMRIRVYNVLKNSKKGHFTRPSTLIYLLIKQLLYFIYMTPLRFVPNYRSW